MAMRLAYLKLCKYALPSSLLLTIGIGVLLKGKIGLVLWYSLIAILLGIVLFTYLIYPKCRMPKLCSQNPTSSKTLTFFLVSCIFLLLGLISYIIAANTRIEVYFLLTYTAVIFMTLGILHINELRPFHTATAFVLLVLLVISLSITILNSYPTLVGIDPWGHQVRTLKILKSGHLDFTLYHSLGMHTLLVILMNITAIYSYKFLTMLSISIISQLLLVIFVYLITFFIFRSKMIAIMASFLLTISPINIKLGVWVIPTTFSLMFYAFLLYSTIRLIETRYVRQFLVISLILVLTLPYTHIHVGLLSLISVLMSLLILFPRRDLINRRSICHVGLVFSIFYLFWTMYISQITFSIYTNFLKKALTETIWSSSITVSMELMGFGVIQNDFVRFMNLIGSLALLVLSVFGGITLVAFILERVQEKPEKYALLLAWMFGLGIVLLFNLASGGILAERIFYEMQIIFVILGSLIVMLSLKDENSQKIISFLIIILSVTGIFAGLLGPDYALDGQTIPSLKPYTLEWGLTYSEYNTYKFLDTYGDKNKTIYSDLIMLLPFRENWYKEEIFKYININKQESLGLGYILVREKILGKRVFSHYIFIADFDLNKKIYRVTNANKIYSTKYTKCYLNL